MVDTRASETKSGTVRSRRPREHLTEAEIERLMAVARQGGRYGHRDATAILVAYRHGLRSSELVDLQWDQIDFVQKTIFRSNPNFLGSRQNGHILGDAIRAHSTPKSVREGFPNGYPTLSAWPSCGRSARGQTGFGEG